MIATFKLRRYLQLCSKLVFISFDGYKKMVTKSSSTEGDTPTPKNKMKVSRSGRNHRVCSKCRPQQRSNYIHPTYIYILSICPYFANRTPHINFQKSELFTTKKRWGNGPPLGDQATTSLAFPCKAKTLSKTAPTRMTSSGLFHAQESINLTCPTERINPIIPKLPEVCGNNRCQHLAWNQPGAFLISC